MTTTQQFSTVDEFYMAGTESTGEYIVPAVSKYGRVGFRLLSGGQVRVRIEPLTPQARRVLRRGFPIAEGWKQPDSYQYRFSRVFDNHVTAMMEVSLALKTLSPLGQRLYRLPAKKQRSAQRFALNVCVSALLLLPHRLVGLTPNPSAKHWRRRLLAHKG